MLPELNNAKILKKKTMQGFAEKKSKGLKKSDFCANRTQGQTLFPSALPSLPQTLQTKLANFHVTKKKRKKGDAPS